MDDFLYKRLREMIQGLQRRDFSVHELVQAHLDHIEKVNPHINALVQSNAEQALHQASEADRALAAGQDVGALHGIPFTVKDSLESAGIISSAGTLGRANFIPKRDASIVQRLKQAGAILLGKTNCSELVMPFETDNLVYGRTNNPWDLAHTPGGSTGGEAALIASGGSPLGVAGDAGASIRVPAHFCGIAGIKPTSGRIPRTGHFPQMGGATGSLAAMGPLARSIEDLIIVLPLLYGPDGIDPACIPMPYNSPDAVDIAGLRVAYYSDNGILAASPDNVAAVKNAAQMLSDAGATVIEARPERIESSVQLLNGLFSGDGGQRLRAFLRRIGTAQISPLMQVILDQQPAAAISTAEFMTLLGQLDGLRTALLRFMLQGEFDIILCPVCAVTAPPHGSLAGINSSDIMSYTVTYNLAGWPSATVPVAQTAEGLPVGVQVVAQAWREELLLAAARSIERASGGYQKPPMTYLG